MKVCALEKKHCMLRSSGDQRQEWLCVSPELSQRKTEITWLSVSARVLQAEKFFSCAGRNFDVTRTHTPQIPLSPAPPPERKRSGSAGSSKCGYHMALIVLPLTQRAVDGCDRIMMGIGHVWMRF
ncbi:unnamed protein product [Leuciscus chuanchicus]